MNMNGWSNIAGLFVGVPEVLQGIAQIQTGDWTHAIVSISTGIGAFVMAYFIGKPVNSPGA